MVDGDIYSHGVPVEFFGREMRFPAGPGVLAQHTGALIICGYCDVPVVIKHVEGKPMLARELHALPGSGGLFDQDFLYIEIFTVIAATWISEEKRGTQVHQR